MLLQQSRPLLHESTVTNTANRRKVPKAAISKAALGSENEAALLGAYVIFQSGWILEPLRPVIELLNKKKKKPFKGERATAGVHKPLRRSGPG